MFIIILVSLVAKQRQFNKQSDYGSLKRNFIVALSLAVVIGLGWGLGLLSASYPNEAASITFQVIYAVFVCSQGILLFLLHGIRNSDVRHIWKGWLTCFTTTTRLSFLSSSKKTSTINSSSNDSQSATATLPHALTQKLTEQSMLECLEVVNQNLSEEPAIQQGEGRVLENIPEEILIEYEDINTAKENVKPS